MTQCQHVYYVYVPPDLEVGQQCHMPITDWCGLHMAEQNDVGVDLAVYRCDHGHYSFFKPSNTPADLRLMVVRQIQEIARASGNQATDEKHTDPDLFGPQCETCHIRPGFQSFDCPDCSR